MARITIASPPPYPPPDQVGAGTPSSRRQVREKGRVSAAFRRCLPWSAPSRRSP